MNAIRRAAQALRDLFDFVPPIRLLWALWRDGRDRRGEE